MLENFFHGPVLSSLALTLLHFLWQGLLVATVLKSALLIFNHNKPQLRYALSALAMLVNLLLPLITFIIIYQTEISSVNTLASSLAINEFIQDLKQPDALFTYRELTEILPLLLPYLSVLWLATITLLASKLLIEITTVNKLPQQGTIAPSDKLQARFNELVEQINLTITPRLLISLKVDVPMAIGWLKPVVLLPAKMITGLNSAQLEMLILHELAHIRRHDYLVNFIQTLVEILLFFHPAVLWVSKQMRNEREYCSDDIAVQHCGNAIAYAHTLADTASLCTKAHNHTIPAMAMAASGGDLKQRVVRLVDHHCAPNNNISKWFASATIIFSVLLLSSKQLLTMPLLDIWYNENPWKQLGQTEDKSHISYLKKSSFSENETETNIKESINASNMTTTTATKKELDNTSIAQQLLAPVKRHVSSNTHKTQDSNTTVDSKENFETKTGQPVVAKSNTLATNGLLSLSPKKTQSEKSTKEINQLSEKLNNLVPVNSPELKANIENTVSNGSIMVENAFSRTTSNNAYQHELTELATTSNPNSHQVNPTYFESKYSESKYFKSKYIENNTTDNNHIDKSQSFENTLNKFTETNQQKENKTKAIETIWQNAEQLESVDPVYPSVAKRKGIEIEVKVDFTIDINGQIKNIQFAPQSNLHYFKSAIRSAINKWHFLPAKVDNQPVESQMSKVFAFSLKS